MLRKAVSLLLAGVILAAGLWLLQLQLFEWRATSGFLIVMTAFLIVVGVGWLFVDFVVPLFLADGSAAFLKRADAALMRGGAMLDAAFSAARRAVPAGLPVVGLYIVAAPQLSALPQVWGRFLMRNSSERKIPDEILS